MEQRAGSDSRLWEADHPYYAEDGCYYSRDDVHVVIDGWAAFKTEYGWGDSDPDLNLLYRWDWYTPDPEDLQMVAEDPDDDGSWAVPTLKLYFILQRKAKPFSVHVRNVTEVDEPAIREWLHDRAQTTKAIWEPIL